MPFITILLLIVLSSCQSFVKKSQSTSPIQNQYEADSEDPPMELKNRLRKWNQTQRVEISRPLVTILKNGNLLKSNQEVQLLNVLCQIGAEREEVVSKCTFLKKVGKYWRPLTLRGEIAEELRLELSRFPVSQGDSGVSVSYLRCQNRQSEPTCELAIDLNYEGP